MFEQVFSHNKRSKAVRQCIDACTGFGKIVGLWPYYIEPAVDERGSDRM